MNKLFIEKRSSLSSSSYKDDDLPEEGNNNNIMSSHDNINETTPIFQSSSKQQQKKQNTTNTTNTTNKELSYLKAICTYMKENYTFVIIAFLLLVILALAGENASTENEIANLEEDRMSALKIMKRPCQIHLDQSIWDTNTTSSSSSSSNGGVGNHVKIIQTSLGNPSAHWSEIPCLVRNDQHLMNLKSFEEQPQWSWMFGSSASTSRSKSQEPIVYGKPSAEIKVNFNSIAHPNRKPILGFGGAFTEATALNYMSLSPKGREAVISLLFGKDGLGYSLGRVHINSCDFSVKSYNFDNVTDDFNLTHFDMKVEHDVMSGMIEMMLQANGKLQNDWVEDGVKIMASPWSPPAWMKNPTSDDLEGAVHAVNMTGSTEPNCLREGTGPNSRYAAAWALYFSKFLEAYKNWGIDLFAVTVQNEPEFPAPWEACAYHPENQTEFIANHLGPVLKRDHPDVKLLIFDHNKDHALTWASTILNASSPAMNYVDGTAVHWYAGGMDRLLDGAQGAPNMHRLASLLKMLNVDDDHLVLGSEACHCPSTGYAGGKLDVAWSRAERYAHSILSDLAAGSNGWVEWNLVLDAIGGPNHLGNMCDAPILAVPYRSHGQHNITVLPTFEYADFPFGPVVGDTRTREELDALGFPAEYLDKGIVVQPIFYYMGHISRHVRPGSRAVHALVDHSMSSSDRTFLKKVNNNTVYGGGINDLARPGVEVTLWPCEGSTRQQWKMNDIGQLQVFGHDWLGKATVTCLGSVIDTSFQGLLLSPCDETAGIFHVEHLTNSTVKIMIDNNCLVAKPLENNGGAYGPRGGAQVTIASCKDEAALWNFNGHSGEISSNYFDNDGGEVCVTTGWPFLQVGAFVGPDHQNTKSIVILNEASESANYILRNEMGQVFMTNSIDSHSIQTVSF